VHRKEALVAERGEIGADFLTFSQLTTPQDYLVPLKAFFRLGMTEFSLASKD
jgi:hypothetical protein